MLGKGEARTNELSGKTRSPSEGPLPSGEHTAFCWERVPAASLPRDPGQRHRHRRGGIVLRVARAPPGGAHDGRREFAGCSAVLRPPCIVTSLFAYGFPAFSGLAMPKCSRVPPAPTSKSDGIEKEGGCEHAHPGHWAGALTAFAGRISVYLGGHTLWSLTSRRFVWKQRPPRARSSPRTFAQNGPTHLRTSWPSFPGADATGPTKFA